MEFYLHFLLSGKVLVGYCVPKKFLKGAGRVRDVSTGPEGAIYVVLNKPDKVIRLTPASL